MSLLSGMMEELEDDRGQLGGEGHRGSVKRSQEAHLYPWGGSLHHYLHGTGAEEPTEHGLHEEALWSQHQGLGVLWAASLQATGCCTPNPTAPHQPRWWR